YAPTPSATTMTTATKGRINLRSMIYKVYMGLRKSLIVVIPTLLVVCLAAYGAYVLFYREPTPTDPSLAAYVSAERLDPIFAIEGTDPAKLTSAVTQFVAMRDDIASRYNSSEKKYVQSMYPVDFLTRLPNLEAAR